MLALFALVIQDYFLRDLQTKPVAAFGSFKLEREDCVIVDPPVPVLHYASCRATARLTWSSKDDLIEIRYEDSGGQLSRVFNYPLGTKLPPSCTSTWITAYKNKAGSDEDWRKSGEDFTSTLTKCSRLTPAHITSYRDEFLAAAPYYGRATAGLRSLALAMFGSLWRCTAFKSAPLERVICTRKEGPPK